MTTLKTVDLKELNQRQVDDKKNKIQEMFSMLGIDETLKALNQYANYNQAISSWYDIDENDKIKFYPKILAKKLMKEYKCINVTGKEFETLTYKNGTFTQENKLRQSVNDSLINKDTNPDHHRNLTLKEIREACLTNPDDINKNKNLINFKNGMYDIIKNELVEHNEKYLSTIQLNAEYNANKSNKKIEDTLFGHLIRTSLSDDSRVLLQEIFGYCLTLRMDAQKFFILNGKGSNGKSQILNVLKALFPKNVTASLELKHFQDDVRVFNIFNKYINICSDISAEYIEDDAIVKRASGEDWITANPKYRDGIEFECTAKMIFSCNELPNVSDKTYGFMRRLIIVPFDKKIEEKDKIYSIAKKIIQDKDTMNLVVEWSIEGLKRLIKNNWVFTEGEKIKEAKTEYELDNNSVKRFMNEYCTLNIKDSFIPVTEFKNYYKLWCEQEDIRKLGNKNIESQLSNIGDKRKNTLFKGWYYTNVAWNKDIFDIAETVNGFVDNYNEFERKSIELEGK